MQYDTPLIPPASPSNSTVGIISGIVESIFEAYGIKQITFTSGLFNSSRKKRQTAQNALDSIRDYGCWCTKPFTGDGFMGQPLDDVDRICKLWSQCNRCIGLSTCTKVS